MIRNFQKWQAQKLLQKAVSNKTLLYFKDRSEWRKWLEKNHGISHEVWLIYYKKHTGKQRIPYDDAVEEALCFGWIDSTVKRIDDEKYCQKYTPRRKRSIWSDLNKNRVKKLTVLGFMREPGKIKIREAKESGMWDREYPSIVRPEHSPELASALEKDPVAKKNFNQLAPSKRKMYIAWIALAKKEETRIKRTKEAIDLLKKGKELGMK